MPSLPDLSNDQETVPETPDFDDDEPIDFGAPTSASSGNSLFGAGLAGAAIGGVLADVAVTSAGVGLSGELLTDAALAGAIFIGGLGAYAATRPDEAGEAARFVGGAVSDTTSAYAELAALNAELALLEQQQKALKALDSVALKVQALPGEVVEGVTTTVTETVETVKAAPQKMTETISNRVRNTISSIQSEAQAQLDAAKREVDKLKGGS